MFRSRSWFSSSSAKPKNPHSLEYLKYLQGILVKNQQVSESNKSLLVETLRSIAEILIWGDQNDSTVFDFFLEKNMLSYFLKIMKQKCGSYVCVQLLQTLNILFENIRNETSLYYLLSNNHVNSIIEHKFDFSDEEVMAYYISFLKTLSLKLNSHTIHFFYNEHTHDFPLYTEAIKFFNNSESMVRIAVRTLTLNVYKVDDKSMLQFIRDKTAAPYFSNLVWFIGNHVIDVDTAIKKCCEEHEEYLNSRSKSRLDDLVAEHLDHLHYVNDILLLGIDDLNQVLTDHLLNRLFLPLYIHSLSPQNNDGSSQKSQQVSRVLALFLLTQVFAIVTHQPLLNRLADFIDEDNWIDCSENDYLSFYALTLFWSVLKFVSDHAKVKSLFYTEDTYNEELVRKLITLIAFAVKFDTKVRIATLSVATTLMEQIVIVEDKSILSDRDLAQLESHREENISTLQNYYKTEEMFLEIFEDEFVSLGTAASLEHLVSDSVFLLPPVATPLSGVHLDKRSPCGEGERCRRSMRVYFLLRSLSLKLRGETERYLPLTNIHATVQLEQNLDLTNSDLLACTVITQNQKQLEKFRRFLVVDSFQLILVDPSHKRMGWGVVKFVGFLQDLDVQGDPNDSRCLHITVKSSPIKQPFRNVKPMLTGKFVFDDHIRCMAARQRLTKGRQKARERKLQLICRVFDNQLKSYSPPESLKSNRPQVNRYQPLSKNLPGLAVVVSESSSTSSRRVKNAPKQQDIPLEDKKSAAMTPTSPSEEEATTSFVVGAIHDV